MNDETPDSDCQYLFSPTRRKILIAPALMGLGLGLTAGMSEFTFAATNDNVRGKGAPTRGGILTRRIAGDPPNFDTLSNTTGWVPFVVGPCYNGLVRFDEMDSEKIVPELAESYEISPDGKAYTFHLKKGVKFHDGKSFSSEDVKYTFDLIRDPPKGIISVRANLLDAIDSIVAIDALTVRFLLKRKSPSLMANLACGWMVVLPKHILEKGPMKDVIIGTGPFKFKEYKRGVSIDLVRNSEYHVPGRPYLDGIKFFFIPDDNTAYGYFRTGQIDEWVPTPAVALAREKELASRAYLQRIFSTSASCLHFNTREKPFDDIRVRQAMCLAINRQQALDTVFNGQGVADMGFSMPGPWALPKSALNKIPGYGPYKDSNIAQAKALLAAAGFPNGFKETMLVRRLVLFEAQAIFIKDQLTKVGIDLTLDFQETAAYNEKVRSRQWKLDAGSMSPVLNDPDATYSDSVTCEGNSNVSKLCDAKIDDLVLRQTQELDVKKRVALVNEIESRTLAQYGSYVMFYKNRFRMYQNNVHGWGLHPNEDNVMRLDGCWKSARTAT